MNCCLQVAIKNNVDVFYFSCVYPLHIIFSEDGLMDKKMFLSAWKELPVQEEAHYQLDVALAPGQYPMH